MFLTVWYLLRNANSQKSYVLIVTPSAHPMQWHHPYQIKPIMQYSHRQYYHFLWELSLLQMLKGAAAAAKLLQSCPTLCDPIDSSPPSSPIPGILQARTLEWVAISFSNARKWKVKVKSLRRVGLVATPWTVAHQAPPSMGFSRQEYWSGVPLPSLKRGWDYDKYSV